MFDLPVEKGGGYQNVCERMLWRYRRLGTPPPSKKKTAAEQIRELREQNQ
jgi:hypothetical protein